MQKGRRQALRRIRRTADAVRRKRLVITGELEEHQRLSVATLKQVASTDKLTIEEKYKQPETVKQSHTLIE